MKRLFKRKLAMSNPNVFDLVFEEWKALLTKKDRSTNFIESNFEELFEELRRAGASFEEAHAILPRAVKAHLPSPSLVKNVYKNIKFKPGVIGTSEKEFSDRWCDDITSKGSSAFFNIYPLDKPQVAEEPKIYGSLTVKEHRQQRDYLSQFPVLNTAALEQQLNSNMYNPLENLENILGGENNE